MNASSGKTVANGAFRYDWAEQEVLALFELPFNELLFQAATAHRQYFDPNKMQKSTLLSIKTGACPEDCKYCPQSAHYNTGLQKEPLMDVAEVLEKAKQAKAAGAERFCMGAAWRKLHDKDVPVISQMIEGVKGLGLETCMTLGMLTQSQAASLKDAGLDYYNHNLDSSESFYKEIISTRSYDDRLETLQHVRDAGIHVCAGGIIGMGETVQDRAQMLATLANMNPHPDSVPINKLIPIPGTPLAASSEVDIFDFVRVIAVARIMMPSSYIRLSAGRESMSEEAQSLCFFAGANSIFYGEELLTAANPGEDQDNQLMQKLGMATEATASSPHFHASLHECERAA